jgi:hypothetical protein
MTASTPLHEEIRFQQAELRGLDSTQPKHLSPLEIQAIIGQDAKLPVSGGVAPFAQRLSLANVWVPSNSDVAVAQR